MALCRQLIRFQVKPAKSTIRCNVKFFSINSYLNQNNKPFKNVESQSSSQQQGDDIRGPSHSDNKKDEDLKKEILNVALNHVNVIGWNTGAIAAAAEEIGLSPSISSMFKDYDLVNYFISKSNLELENHLSENQLSARNAIEWRLQKVVPYAKGYSEAIAIITKPEHVKESVHLLLNLSDSIVHHSLKDTSTNINWYTKRLAIATIYASSEMCLIQDESQGYSETWKFLDRRSKEIEKINKGEFSFGSLPIPLPELIHVGFITLKNILGRNAPR